MCCHGPHSAAAHARLTTAPALDPFRCAAAAGKEISTRPFQLVTGRKWMGTAFGGYKARDGVPELVTEYLEGGLKLDHFVSSRFDGLGATQEAIDSMHSGKVLRAIVSY